MEPVKAIQPSSTQCPLPPKFDANEFLGSSWALRPKLRFAPSIARTREETAYHPSQVLKKSRDGSAMMTLKVAEAVELLAWTLGRGETVEVIRPRQPR
ncbi:MAG: WYL domain-containing protein [Chloroflexi bacterium]|nr:WYL domain-containing protein [Chloroflexota bacterium]